MKRDPETIESIERRRFFALTGKYGFTAAVVAGAAGSLLISEEAAAASAKEERDREKAAKYKMTIATAYVLGATRSYPIMQLDFKENIQNVTNGQVYVKLAPGRPAGGRGCAGAKSAAGHHPGSPTLDLQLCALCTGRRPDQSSLFLWRKPEVR